MTDVKLDLVKELHKPARRFYPRRRVIVKGIDELWQADLADFQQYSRENRGNKYILVVIDCFSKFLWTRPIKNKSGDEIVKAFKDIFKQGRGRIPKNLQTDNGKEFYNKPFKDLLEKHNINLYSTYTTMKASIVERVIRTLKNRLYRMFSLNGNYKYIDKLDRVTADYNNTIHSTIGMAPSKVTTKRIEKQLLKTVYSHIKVVDAVTNQQKFKVGDIVRISKQKALFDKGYTPNWSTELFKIAEVKLTSPTVYMLHDFDGHEIKGAFYGPELQRAKHKDVFLVEKILRKKGNKVYVKWLGLDKKNNSWINKSDVL